MFLFPEWVGISKKDENKTDSTNEVLSSFLESKGTKASDSEITNTEKVSTLVSKNPTKD
jgi:hypothetical protein